MTKLHTGANGTEVDLTNGEVKVGVVGVVPLPTGAATEAKQLPDGHNVVVSSSALPAGASTEATLALLLAKFVTNGDGRVTVQSKPYYVSIAEGEVANHESWRKFGRNGAIGATIEDIHEPGGTYYYLPSAQQLKISSSSGLDAAAGTGAQKVTITGLDSNYDELEEEVTMVGGGTATTTGSFFRVNRARVTAAGTGGTNAGNISIKDNAAANTVSYISTGNAQTLQAVYTVPNGKEHYVVRWNVSETGAKATTVFLFAKPFGEVSQVKDSMDVNGTANTHTYDVPLKFEGKTELAVRAVSAATGAAVSSSWGGWLETE